MPWSALPEHLNHPSKWDGWDDDKHWYTKWRKYVKGWFAYGPRATEWWANWMRYYPVTLFALRGRGYWRTERDGGADQYHTKRFYFLKTFDARYLARTQHFTRWHVQLQWPLFLAFHFYFSNDAIPKGSLGYKKRSLLYFYVGCKRDADIVYWFPAVFLGLTWK